MLSVGICAIGINQKFGETHHFRPPTEPISSENCNLKVEDNKVPSEFAFSY